MNKNDRIKMEEYNGRKTKEVKDSRIQGIEV
jgi:hypothetical protein